MCGDADCDSVHIRTLNTLTLNATPDPDPDPDPDPTHALDPDRLVNVLLAGGTHSASVLRTLFAWNNETLNAWTIVAGVLVGVAGMSHVRWSLNPDSSPTPDPNPLIDPLKGQDAG